MPFILFILYLHAAALTKAYQVYQADGHCVCLALHQLKAPFLNILKMFQ